MGGVSFPGNKRYEGVRFNVISVTRGWVGVKFPGKKRYVTLGWPLTQCISATGTGYIGQTIIICLFTLLGSLHTNEVPDIF